MSPAKRQKKLATWQLGAQFAAGLSAMYAGEVPAYATLVEVSGQVNADYAARHHDAERFGSAQRVTVYEALSQQVPSQEASQ